MNKTKTAHETANPRNPQSSRSVVQPEQPDNATEQCKSVTDEEKKPGFYIGCSTIWYNCVLRVEGTPDCTREVVGSFLTTDDQGETLLNCEKVTPMPSDIRSYYASLDAYHAQKSDPRWLKAFHEQRMHLSDKYHFNGDPSWWMIRHWATSDTLSVSISPHGLSFLAEQQPGFGLVPALASRVRKRLLLSWYQLEAEICGYFRCDENGRIYEEEDFQMKEAPAWVHAALGLPEQVAHISLRR